jgi:hypothetical protein
MGAMTATAHAKNRSEQPVYDLLFIWHDDCRPVAKTQRLRPLDAQHDQLESLRKVNEKQIEVLGLQATDLRESLDERKREAEELRSAQAARVFISQINGTRFKSTELNMSELLDSDTPIEFPASEPECFRATLTAGLLLSLVWTARNWPVRPPAHRDSPSANSPVRTHWFLVHSGRGQEPPCRAAGQARTIDSPTRSLVPADKSPPHAVISDLTGGYIHWLAELVQGQSHHLTMAPQAISPANSRNSRP